MRGIAGVFRLTGRPGPEEAAVLLRMLDAQRHRGPDDWGLLVPASVAGTSEFLGLTGGLSQDHISRYAGDARPGVMMGARGLAILDRSTRGRMPMGDRESRLCEPRSRQHVVLPPRPPASALAPDGPGPSDASVRQTVAKSLGLMGNDAVSVPVLIQLVTCTMPDAFGARWQAAQSLVATGKKRNADTINRRLGDLLQESDRMTVTM